MPAGPGNEDVVFSVRLASGNFSSELRMPLPKNKAETDKMVARWLDFMATGIRICAEKMDAEWTETGATNDQ